MNIYYHTNLTLDFKNSEVIWINNGKDLMIRSLKLLYLNTEHFLHFPPQLLKMGHLTTLEWKILLIFPRDYLTG